MFKLTKSRPVLSTAVWARCFFAASHVRPPTGTQNSSPIRARNNDARHRVLGVKTSRALRLYRCELGKSWVCDYDKSSSRKNLAEDLLVHAFRDSKWSSGRAPLNYFALAKNIELHKHTSTSPFYITSYGKKKDNQITRTRCVPFPWRNYPGNTALHISDQARYTSYTSCKCRRILLNIRLQERSVHQNTIIVYDDFSITTIWQQAAMVSWIGALKIIVPRW